MRYLLALLLVSPASGQLIDDFDDLAQTVSPAMDNDFITTLNVGPLDAKREIRLASFAADPDATMRIDNGTLFAEVGNLHSTSSFQPQFAAQLYYEFAPADFSAGNAFMLDFNSVVGMPDFVRILIWDDQLGNSYFTDQSFVSEGSYTLAVPFADFVRRDGVPWSIHFDSIDEISVGIHAHRSRDPNHHWAVEIDRFYVGTVPEPEGMFLFLFALFWRRRTCAPSC